MIAGKMTNLSRRFQTEPLQKLVICGRVLLHPNGVTAIKFKIGGKWRNRTTCLYRGRFTVYCWTIQPYDTSHRIRTVSLRLVVIVAVFGFKLERVRDLHPPTSYIQRSDTIHAIKWYCYGELNPDYKIESLMT